MLARRCRDSVVFRVVVEALDITEDPAIEALAARYRDQPIDALISNAGVAGDLGAGVESLSPDELAIGLRRRVPPYAS